MTADAKVGLLLGLFFIVLIAFLINGLPSFLQSANAEDVIKTTSVVAPSGPDLVIDHRVTETAENLMDRIPLRIVQPPEDVIVLQGASSQASAPGQSAAQPRAAQNPDAAVIAEQVSRLPDPDVQHQPSPSRSTQPGPREHTVQRGQNLATIARLYYGPEEGNRRAVIQKLYEANTDVLDSPDKVIAGMTLTIPPLQTPQSSSAPAQRDASEGLLQRFSNLFERSSAPPEPTRAAPGPKTVEYVVQPGDSLWKIAEKTLGQGHQFNVIVELNKDRLKSPDDVVVGMTLVVPAS